MWWNGYGPMPWMLFGPFMTLLVVAVVAAALFVIFGGAMRRRQHAGGRTWSMGCCGFSDAAVDDGAKSEPQAGGHSAFDGYRADTLRRLEEEQREFQEFLGRLRTAKDKAEFDQFMAERRSASSARAAWPRP